MRLPQEPDQLAETMSMVIMPSSSGTALRNSAIWFTRWRTELREQVRSPPAGASAPVRGGEQEHRPRRVVPGRSIRSKNCRREPGAAHPADDTLSATPQSLRLADTARRATGRGAGRTSTRRHGRGDPKGGPFLQTRRRRFGHGGLISRQLRTGTVAEEVCHIQSGRASTASGSEGLRRTRNLLSLPLKADGYVRPREAPRTG